MTNMTLQEQLQKEIHTKLTAITQSSHPYLFSRCSTQEGYANIQDTLISMVIKQRISLQTAINNLESDAATN